MSAGRWGGIGELPDSAERLAICALARELANRHLAEAAAEGLDVRPASVEREAIRILHGIAVELEDGLES